MDITSQDFFPLLKNATTFRNEIFTCKFFSYIYLYSSKIKTIKQFENPKYAFQLRMLWLCFTLSLYGVEDRKFTVVQRLKSGVPQGGDGKGLKVKKLRWWRVLLGEDEVTERNRQLCLGRCGENQTNLEKNRKRELFTRPKLWCCRSVGSNPEHEFFSLEQGT